MRLDHILFSAEDVGEGNYRLQDIQLSDFARPRGEVGLFDIVRDDPQGDEAWLSAPLHPVGPRTTTFHF